MTVCGYRYSIEIQPSIMDEDDTEMLRQEAN